MEQGCDEALKAAMRDSATARDECTRLQGEKQASQEEVEQVRAELRQFQEKGNNRSDCYARVHSQVPRAGEKPLSLVSALTEDGRTDVREKSKESLEKAAEDGSLLSALTERSQTEEEAQRKAEEEAAMKAAAEEAKRTAEEEEAARKAEEEAKTKAFADRLTGAAASW